MLDSLEEPEPEPLAELPELDDPFAASSRWHCSSAAPVRPVHSGLEPVVPPDDGDALLEELSVLDDPELVLGLLLDELELGLSAELPPLGLLAELLLLGLLAELLLLGLLDELSDALAPVPLELLP